MNIIKIKNTFLIKSFTILKRDRSRNLFSMHLPFRIWRLLFFSFHLWLVFPNQKYLVITSSSKTQVTSYLQGKWMNWKEQRTKRAATKRGSTTPTKTTLWPTRQTIKQTSKSRKLTERWEFIPEPKISLKALYLLILKVTTSR